MPHVPIIIDEITALNQMDGYHETITEDMGTYTGDEQRQQAQAILDSVIDLATNQKADVEAKVAEMENFLGI